MPAATAATCATSSTVTSGRVRDWSPPRKSASPQHSEEEKARTTASTGRQPSGGSAAGRGARAGELGELEAGLLARSDGRGGSSIPLAAPVQQLHGTAEEAGGPRLVREHMEVALGREARHQQRLLAGVLADAAGAVARAEPGRLPAAHGQLEREVVQLRIVDAHGSGLDPARERLTARRVLGPDGRGQAVR